MSATFQVARPSRSAVACGTVHATSRSASPTTPALGQSSGREAPRRAPEKRMRVLRASVRPLARAAAEPAGSGDAPGPMMTAWVAEVTICWPTASSSSKVSSGVFGQADTERRTATKPGATATSTPSHRVTSSSAPGTPSACAVRQRVSTDSANWAWRRRRAETWAAALSAEGGPLACHWPQAASSSANAASRSAACSRNAEHRGRVHPSRSASSSAAPRPSSAWTRVLAWTTRTCNDRSARWASPAGGATSDALPAGASKSPSAITCTSSALLGDLR